MPPSALSTSIREYLKAIWIVGPGERATTSALAECFAKGDPA